MDLQQVINSPFAVSLAALIGRIVPPGIGYPLCDLIGDQIAARRASKVTRAVRANQWVIRGGNLEEGALDRAVRETLRSSARDLYNLYHYLQNPRAMQRMIVLEPAARELVERPEFSDCGLVLVGLHLSNFDFVVQSIARGGFKALVLTIPDPQGGRRVEYEIRRRTGMNLVPASVGTLRQAVRHLERGGTVLTGADHPAPGSKHHPRFFGQPAFLPTHYAYLASKAHVPVVILAVTQQADGKYHVRSSAPIEMDHDPDHETGLLRNAEKVLEQAEDFIRLAPQQWNMPVPVWPELQAKVPG